MSAPCVDIRKKARLMTPLLSHPLVQGGRRDSGYSLCRPFKVVYSFAFSPDQKHAERLAPQCNDDAQTLGP